MTTTNPELEAALATVPEIKRTADLHESAKRRLSRHRDGEEPTQARDRVVDEAVQSFAATGRWPSDVAERAAAALAEAAMWEAERIALRRAVDYTELLAIDAYEMNSEIALAHLARRLSDVLSDALAASEKLGGARSAEEAIRIGGDAVEAWGQLQACVSDVGNIRAAQWDAIMPPLSRNVLPGSSETRTRLTRWRNAGHGEVRGVRFDDMPEGVKDAIRSRSHTVASVLWVAESGAAYVPDGADELSDEVEAATPAPVFFDDHGPVTLRVIETPIPTPKAPDVYPHSTTPQLDFSGPTPKNPKPTATPGDPVPPVWRY
ncbi:hypothetical protein [Streptomyces sp. NPDC001809]